MASKTVTYKTQWLGDALAVGIMEALGFGLVEIGTEAAILAKDHAHVVTGNMQRSIHTAEKGYQGEGDLDYAEMQDLLPLNALWPSSEGPFRWVIEMGSWVPYAATEEVLRNHQFVTPGVALVCGAPSHMIMLDAFIARRLV